MRRVSGNVIQSQDMHLRSSSEQFVLASQWCKVLGTLCACIQCHFSIVSKRQWKHLSQYRLGFHVRRVKARSTYVILSIPQVRMCAIQRA